MSTDPVKLAAQHVEWCMPKGGACSACDLARAVLSLTRDLEAATRRGERWQSLATKAAPAMAFTAGRTDHHATSVATGIAWCNEFKDAKNGIPEFATDPTPADEGTSPDPMNKEKE